MAVPTDIHPPGQPTTCILWTAAATSPAELASLLRRRGFHSQTVSDRFAAMAAACCAAREGHRPVIILDEPDRLRGAQELIDAVRGRLPQVAIWTFDAQRRPQLTGLSGPLAAGDTANIPRNGSVQPQAPLRLVPQPHQPDSHSAEPAPESPAEESHQGASILTAEELEMLLTDESEERGKR